MKACQRLLIALLGAFVVFPVFAKTNSAPTKLNEATVHHVGECYGGGVIFYVNKTPNAPAGLRGLIAANADVAGSFAWDTKANGQEVLKTEARLFSGDVNSARIVGQIGSARAQAVSTSYHYTDGTYHDWYLPSQTELSTLYFHALAKGSSFWTHCGATVPSAATYWSSTQEGLTNAWGVSFAGGVVVVAHKNNSFLVRPIRAF